jgi:6-phospho-3-hexuloisomerase
MMGTLSTIVSEIEHVLSEVDETQVDTFADQLLAASRVFVTGEGRSGLMAKAFAMRLMHLGLTVYVVGETTTPALKGSDSLVAVSGSGTTEGTVHIAQQAKKLGSTIFTVTTNPESPLATLATYTLIIPAATKWRRAGEFTSIQPLGSLFDQCCHVALDAVCLHIAERKDISNEAARQLHTNME